MPRGCYTLLLRAALPFAMLAFLCRGLWRPAYRGSLRERLSWNPPTRADRPVWLHAASVGEVQALTALLRALHAEGLPLLLTVGTPTGLARARALFADLLASSGPPAAFSLQAAPWDLPGAARRLLAAMRPRALVLVETELWPNWLAACQRAGVPVTLVSARLSARSLGRYRRWLPRLMHEAVRSLRAIGAQSADDADRYVALGADPARVSATGNLKFDLPLAGEVAAQGAALRGRWAKARWVWVAGSTHAGEEPVCLQAHRLLLARAAQTGAPPPLLVLAPRRPERFDAVSTWLDAQALHTARLSAPPSGIDPQVLLLDRMGELLAWYAAADAAFVGGTLVPVGGHNLLEPAALGRPVLAGPSTHSAPQVARLLEEAGALQRVHDARDLAQALQQLLDEGPRAMERGARGAAVVAAGRGASDRARALLGALP